MVIKFIIAIAIALIGIGGTILYLKIMNKLNSGYVFLIACQQGSDLRDMVTKLDSQNIPYRLQRSTPRVTLTDDMEQKYEIHVVEEHSAKAKRLLS